jgi:hypothetical protein
MPALPPYIMEPIFEQFEALLPERVVHHPLGCHKPRIPDRVILEKLVQILVFGCAYRRIAEEDPIGAQQGESVIVADDRGEPHVAELHELPSADDEALMESNRPKDDWISRNGRQRREVKGSWCQRKADFLASKTDPDSSLMRRRQSKGSHLGYYTHYG